MAKAKTKAKASTGAQFVKMKEKRGIYRKNGVYMMDPERIRIYVHDQKAAELVSPPAAMDRKAPLSTGSVRGRPTAPKADE